jgi:hypothetical protein
MDDYNRQQREALGLARRALSAMPRGELQALLDSCAPYLDFRERTARFLARHFSRVCTLACYTDGRSACCQKEGIITFFADVAVNVLVSGDTAPDTLERVLDSPNTGQKCVYLGTNGCLWKIKPVVCEMFLCDSAKATVFSENTAAALEWEELQRLQKTYTWPDRPVLFNALEERFLALGLRSPLMYLHNSPGLLMVKKRAGLPVPPKDARP